MSNKQILGFTGLIASGKGTAAKYFVANHNAVSFRFSTILRDVLDRLSLSQSRENMQKITPALLNTFGQDLLAKVITKDVQDAKSDLVVVDGMRRPADIKYLKDIPGFQMVAVDADPKIRYQRIVARGENADDKNKTWEQFLEDHKAETEIYIPDLMKQADVTVDNNSSLEDLYKQLDKLVK